MCSFPFILELSLPQMCLSLIILHVKDGAESVLHVLIHSPKTGCRIIQTIRLLWKLSINNWITPDLCTRHVFSVPRPLSYNGKPPLTHYCLKDFALSFLRLHTPYLKNHISRDPLWPLTLGAPHGPYNGASMDTRKYNELSWQQDCLVHWLRTLSSGTPPPSIFKIYNELSNSTN